MWLIWRRDRLQGKMLLLTESEHNKKICHIWTIWRKTQHVLILPTKLILTSVGIGSLESHPGKLVRYSFSHFIRPPLTSAISPNLISLYFWRISCCNSSPAAFKIAWPAFPPLSSKFGDVETTKISPWNYFCLQKYIPCMPLKKHMVKHQQPMWHCAKWKWTYKNSCVFWAALSLKVRDATGYKTREPWALRRSPASQRK